MVMVTGGWPKQTVRVLHREWALKCPRLGSHLKGVLPKAQPSWLTGPYGSLRVPYGSQNLISPNVHTGPNGSNGSSPHCH